jgi:hypothetical protein
MIFRLLVAICPEDMAERAANILSVIEVGQYFPRAKTTRLTLGIYHRVLHCLLEATKHSKSNPSEAAERALILVEKLEAQSSPLLLSDSEVQSATIQNLYDTNLRPSPRTYRLVLQICSSSCSSRTEHPEEQERAAEIALDVYRRMVACGISPGAGSDKLLKKCHSFLEEGSSMREELESLFQIEDADANTDNDDATVFTTM